MFDIYHKQEKRADSGEKVMHVYVCVCLCYPEPPTRCSSALIGFAADLSHLHLKKAAPCPNLQGQARGTLSVFRGHLKCPLSKRKQQEDRLGLICTWQRFL